MKRIFTTIMMITVSAQVAWSDGVVMATAEDLAAFDNMIREDRTKRDVTLRREAGPKVRETTTFKSLVKDEAAKLKNEGSQGGGSQPGKWVVEQKKNGRAGTDSSDSKEGRRIREEQSDRRGRGRN
ncbi:MAG TPA: hypothetical protein VFV50_16850 [Bdellovibrionales bacterium]|nr:hypothetical protein [Bdellovibrionales bacterium]